VIEVVAAGPLSSIQTPIGRPGWRRFGVPVGGAADGWSARLANRLAGNPDAAGLIEVTLGGAALRFDGPTVVAHTGGTVMVVDGLAAPPASAVVVRGGATLRVEPGDGARGYVAFGGGIELEPVLGSVATDLRTGFGGLDGRALRDGDRLRIGPTSSAPCRWRGAASTGPIRLVDGPHGSAWEIAGQWKVGTEADRTGVRLDGRTVHGGEVPSMGLPRGAVQVPLDGRPIVMLADRPVTGGYRVPACVISADVGRVAQLRPGDAATFVSVTLAEARAALAEAEAALAAVEPLMPSSDDDLGWVGSHG
jgi:biotin-dependent carboxylase-like uncharacterized protein